METIDKHRRADLNVQLYDDEHDNKEVLAPSKHEGIVPNFDGY